ncbi:D-sedoheptulose 7-phosphate isomerase [Breznakibacter xylanolyticus]|uniref:Phosphoheptose isomerase n=1 Tax=Breznakibacter xylanolyticus TaxID=990 RepID=A0A2W7NFY3_9BACT|nr:D-sedoheptulose 7-phosphate isomerase [Breznakibacter xylanolyticus]PZX19295.1 D-sedoheptulose 7-phosphate isomerase [Breznakibacter xylanolyticus]
MHLSHIQSRFEEARQLLDSYMGDARNMEQILQAAQLISEAIHRGHKVISCGNGGSMSDAMHFAEELSGRFRDHRRSLPAIAISDPSHITCVANDYGFDHIFSRFVEGLGNSGDVLLAISTSGNSPNVINAVLQAREKGMKVIALTGKTGGKLKDMCDVSLHVDYQGYSDRIQEIHIKIIHIVIEVIEKMCPDQN